VFLDDLVIEVPEDGPPQVAIVGEVQKSDLGSTAGSPNFAPRDVWSIRERLALVAAGASRHRG
jgi:hypothetical protein